jgi:hypothetical protein
MGKIKVDGGLIYLNVRKNLPGVKEIAAIQN